MYEQIKENEWEQRKRPHQNVRDTSRIAHGKNLSKGTYITNKSKLLQAAIEFGMPATREMLSRRTRIKINSCTNPIRQLLDEGKIKEIGKDICKETKHLANYLVPVIDGKE